MKDFQLVENIESGKLTQTQCRNQNNHELKSKEIIPSVLEPAQQPPLVLHKSVNYGNYYIASREIEPGELIFEEISLSASPYGYDDTAGPYCLSCYKDLAFSQKCKLCRWPICNEECSAAYQHSDNECQILSTNKVKYKQGQPGLEDLAIETLRCLLLRDKNQTKWEHLLKLEAHIGPRRVQGTSKIQETHVITFIRKRCNLINFDVNTISQVFGINCVNSFSGFAYNGRHVSVLFAQTSFFNHDCTPNTIRKFTDGDNDPITGALRFSVQIFASRFIKTRELISLSYGIQSAELISRANFLSHNFFFHCDCQRCRRELFNEIQCDTDLNN